MPKRRTRQKTRKRRKRRRNQKGGALGRRKGPLTDKIAYGMSMFVTYRKGDEYR